MMAGAGSTGISRGDRAGPANRSPIAVVESRSGRAFLLLTVFLSGFSVMVLEMAAARALAPYFGASNYTWTNVIGVILAALAAGYFLGGRLADRLPRVTLLYTILLAAGVLCLVLPHVVRPVSRWLLPANESLEGAVALIYRASLVATLLLFAPPAFVLGTVSPLAIKLLARPEAVGRASGQVFAASTVGSILGTFLTTLLLVPLLGTRETIALAGVVLGGTAVPGFVLFSVAGRRVRSGAAAGLVIAVLAAGGHALAAGRIKHGEGQIEERETAYQYVRVRDVTEDGTPVRLLQINEAETAYQSVLIPGRVLTGGRYYDYYSVLPLLLGAPDRSALDTLVIGVAAGTIPVQLRHFYPRGLRVTGVEIDPGVLELGRRLFSMPSGEDWFRTVVMDGRVFLEIAPRRKPRDLIIIDAFAEEYYIPFHLATREAFARARDRLRRGGILALNVASYGPDSELLRSLTATIADVFGRCYRVWVSGYPNYMLFAVRDAGPDFQRLVRLPSTGPPEWDRLRELARAVAVSVVTRRRGEGGGGAILTDDRAPVERLTDEDVLTESRAILGE